MYHKIRDHCHYTGKYRGAAHDICSLRYKVNLNAWEKIERNILPFLYQLEKKLIIVKQLHKTKVY